MAGLVGGGIERCRSNFHLVKELQIVLENEKVILFNKRNGSNLGLFVILPSQQNGYFFFLSKINDEN